MKYKMQKNILILIFFLTVSCGFKVLDKSSTSNFKIKEVQTSGDKRINFKIKNNLLINSFEESTNILLIQIKTKKQKSIKEKNIKNEITKYQITLISDVVVQSLQNTKNFNFSTSLTNDFLVGRNYSTTLTNEKRIIDFLVEGLSEKILSKINLEINDN
jgi:hypothetical protein